MKWLNVRIFILFFFDLFKKKKKGIIVSKAWKWKFQRWKVEEGHFCVCLFVNYVYICGRISFCKDTPHQGPVCVLNIIISACAGGCVCAVGTHVILCIMWLSVVDGRNLFASFPVELFHSSWATDGDAGLTLCSDSLLQRVLLQSCWQGENQGVQQSYSVYFYKV